MQVIVRGIPTNYEDSGKGKVLLLLHGWGDTLRTFDGVIAGLQGYRCVSLDLPGFGGTAAPKDMFTLDDYAQFVRDFLEKVGISQPHAVVGHSNGGAIAIKALASGYIAPQKAVLIASAGVRQPYDARNKLLRIAAKLAKLPIMLLPKATQTKVKKRVYGAIGSDLFVAEGMQETFKNVVSEDIVEEAAGVTTQSLLIYGSEDTATPPVYGEKFAHSMPNARLEVIEGTDHFLHQHHVAEVLELITPFMEAKA